MASTIQVRVDDDLKAKSDQLFKDFWSCTRRLLNLWHSKQASLLRLFFKI